MDRNLVVELERDGIVVIPDFLTPGQVASMQRVFETRLRRMRWNNFDGYERTERYRHMVEDVLTMDQGFLDAALHPVVKETLAAYLGDRFELVEAKGWKSLPTRKNFHGWHGDAWYDQAQLGYIPKEVKLGLYLTDVRTGAFHYVKGSHRKQHPRLFHGRDLDGVSASSVVEVTGNAGTAFLFDTSGIHRQGMPILEPRYAVFYDYHDPDVPLQEEDRDYYRYHPLLLSAAFLGNLSKEDERILGFGNKKNYIPGFERSPKHSGFQELFTTAFGAKLSLDETWERIRARMGRLRAGRAG
jgi:Phytanoyl-CoA dioxygenase (PhyH)